MNGPYYSKTRRCSIEQRCATKMLFDEFGLLGGYNLTLRISKINSSAAFN